MGRAFEYRRASKEKRWGKMSRVFPKLAKMITTAVKEGGADATMNARLRTAIQNAKAENMPKDNIEAAIKRASGNDAVNYAEITYEAKGPHGVMLIVECATDNTTRTVANIKSYLSKFDYNLLTTGSFDFNFERKSVFEIEKTPEINPEELELELIDAGLEKIDIEEDTLYLYGSYGDFGNLQSALDAKGLVYKAGLKRIPNQPTVITDKQLETIEKLIDRIEEDEDVVAVYTNIN